MDYFKKLLDLLKIEREEDRSSYLKLTQTSSVAERRTNGLTWYPIAIRGSEMGRGDYLTVELERTTHHDIIHQLRSGIPAALFSNHDPKDRIEGTISYQNGNRLKLSLRTDELPEWAQNGKLGVDLLFDDNSYDEMQSALKTAMELTSDTDEERLLKVLTGEKSPTFHPQTALPTLPGLNSSQQAAVQKIVEANELAVVHGPPGTGKTTTLIQAIQLLVSQNDSPILVVAPSNAAVDLLSDKLAEKGLNVVRIGNPARISERLTSLTLDSKIAEHTYSKDIKTLKKRAAEFKNMAHKYKRNFGKAEREQRKALFDEAHKIMREASKTEQYIIDDVTNKAQIITATLVGSNHYTIRDLRYNTVVIDEAGQSLEPACWIPILKAKRVILAGDHFQLPPTIKSKEASEGGLGTTLLEKCAQLHPDSVILLEEQYRMNELIMRYSSSYFYNNLLHAHASVAHQKLFDLDKPLTFIDTAGCGFDEKLEGTSSTNPEEATFLFKHLTLLVDELNQKGTTRLKDFPTIAIISPYKQQISLLKDLVQHATELTPYLSKIAINTIDSFQGQERDIVYISMTRSNNEGEIGFLTDIRRMNVAMTRARKKLVVIGDSATLSQLPFYFNFISYTEEINAYHSAWEFINN